MVLRRALLLCALAYAASSALAQNKFVTASIDPVQPTTVKQAAELPWLADGFNGIREHPQLFTLTANDNDTRTGAWAGVNLHGIFLLLNIEDAYHVNTQTGANIWDGDAVQLGIDANGDGTNGGNKYETYIGPNDAMYAFALTDNGQQGWAHYHGIAAHAGPAMTAQFRITRDEQAGISTYTLFFPWSEFDWNAGLSDYIGLSFMINDTDEAGGQTRTRWGMGVGSQLSPGLFIPCRINYPDDVDITVFTPVKAKLWAEWDQAQFLFATNAAVPTALSFMPGLPLQETVIPAAPEGGFARRLISVTPSISNAPLMTFSLNAVQEGNRVLSGQYVISSRMEVIESFRKAVQTALANNNGTLEKLHINSLSAVVEKEYDLALMGMQRNPNQVATWADYAKQVTASLQAGVESLQNFVIAFTASADNSLQVFRLTLPPYYSREQTYPLIIDLHGAGNPHTMAFISSYEQHGGNETVTDSQVDAFVLSPWGRGNRGYRGYSGDDIYDCILRTKQLFAIDDDRTYLTGFSMGGWGTWYHGLKAPDMWAAIAPCGASLFRSKEIAGVAGNVKDLPVYIWHGQRDGAVPVQNAELMHAKLTEAGGDPVFIIDPEAGHYMPPQDKLKMFEWLLTHTRQPADEFTYTVFNNEFYGRSGIVILTTDFSEGLPSLTFKREGNTLHLTTSGITSMQLNLSETGIDMSQDVTVTWNGEEAYQGEASASIVLD